MPRALVLPPLVAVVLVLVALPARDAPAQWKDRFDRPQRNAPDPVPAEPPHHAKPDTRRLIDVFRHGAPRASAAAAMGLASLAEVEPAAMAALRDGLLSDDPAVRAVAALALSRVPDRGKPIDWAAREMLQDPMTWARAVALSGVGPKLATVNARPPDPGVPQAVWHLPPDWSPEPAARKVGQGTDAEAMEGILDIKSSLHDKRFRDRGVEILLAALDRRSPKVRRAAALAVRQVLPENAAAGDELVKHLREGTSTSESRWRRRYRHRPIRPTACSTRFAKGCGRTSIRRSSTRCSG